MGLMPCDPLTSGSAMAAMGSGWTCPVCNRGVAPGQLTCDHGRIGVLPHPMPEPLIPIMPKVPTWAGGCEACRYSGICMCVRPDHGVRYHTNPQAQIDDVCGSGSA